MPKGIYERSPERLAELRVQTDSMRAAQGWRDRVAAGWFKPGEAHPRKAWTPEMRAAHGESMRRAGVVTKLLRRRTASPCEVLLRDWLESLGFVWQYKVEDVGVADYALPGSKLAVEFEGKYFDPGGESRGAVKLRAYEEHGWRCVVFGYWHVSQYPEHIKGVIRDLVS